jgi:hypothetical protein
LEAALASRLSAGSLGAAVSDGGTFKKEIDPKRVVLPEGDTIASP